MTKQLDVAGTPYADIIVWRWERPRMRWVANLRDGTELVVALQRLGHQSYWNPAVNGRALPNNGLRDPESAQHAAFDEWKRQRQPAAVKLTRDQLAELKLLACAPQPSYGKGRVRVHNNLRRHGLASIDHSDGFVCRITPAGHAFLAQREKRT